MFKFFKRNKNQDEEDSLENENNDGSLENDLVNFPENTLLDSFPSIDEAKYIVESQPVFRTLITKAIESGLIVFRPMETGIILDCPICALPAEIKFSAVDDYSNEMFLLSCQDLINVSTERPQPHNLWVDPMYIEHVLEQRSKS